MHTFNKSNNIEIYIRFYRNLKSRHITYARLTDSPSTNIFNGR